MPSAAEHKACVPVAKGDKLRMQVRRQLMRFPGPVANYFNCAHRQHARIFMLLMGEVGYLVAVMHNLCGVHHMQCGVRSNCLRADLCELLPAARRTIVRCWGPSGVVSLCISAPQTDAAFAYRKSFAQISGKRQAYNSCPGSVFLHCNLIFDTRKERGFEIYFLSYKISTFMMKMK